MPRQPKLLPYLRRSRSGNLQYYRRVPPEKRHLFGGRASFTVVLDCDPTKPRSRAVNQAWAAANEEFERIWAGDTASTAGTSPGDLTKTPLSPRDAAGIAAEPLRQLLASAESGHVTQDQLDLVVSTAAIALQGFERVLMTGDNSAGEQAKAAATQQLVGNLLNQLNIQPDAEGMAAIQKRLFQYAGVAGADLAKQEQGDFSPSELGAFPLLYPNHR